MKLLIVTQKVNKTDPVLGFFHRWVEEFAKHYENITVVCLEKGEYELPSNVKVLSLGKEKGWSKFDRLCWFYQYIWDERKNYDAVFAHMNQEYVLLGTPFWKLMGKRVYMWRNHAKGTFMTSVAVFFSDKVFCTSTTSFTAKYKKASIMPAGIDTDYFKPLERGKKMKNSVLFLGRIAPIKKVKEFVEWIKEHPEYKKVTIAGEALPKDKSYEKKVLALVKDLGLEDRITFVGSVRQSEALDLYQSHEAYANLTPSGSLDKTILEAASCGLQIVVENPDLKVLEGKSGEEAREYVVLNHSLDMLVQRLKKEIMPTSTSIHGLNADTGLNFPQKIAYLILNWVNNLLPYSNIDKRIKIKFWKSDVWEKRWGDTYKESSAARKLSDLFWMTLDWQEIKKGVGDIHVFDTGCGSGNYGDRIIDWSKGEVKSYTGVDAKPRKNWESLEKKHKDFHLISSRSTDISALIPEETNFYMTQSAIEHFDSDLVFFEQIKADIEKKKKKAIQVHLFPGAATLPLYLFHGLRQYNPRTISKITRLFDSSYSFELIGLGGNRAKIVHFKYFTWPVLIMRKSLSKPVIENPLIYDIELRSAIAKDMEKPSISPIFWALIIRSY